MSRLPPSQRADYPVFEALALRWDDNDIYGHLNNTVHYRLTDTAVNQWLLREGLLDLHHSAHLNMVVETGCRFHAEAGFPDRVCAGLKVLQIGTSSVRWQIGLFRNDDASAFADLSFSNVRAGRLSRRPEPLPEDHRAALSRLIFQG
ncbi:acyl-CoA thioesterase [Falsigemmobacter faecalis]|uniref:Acyl-CoA thioesterase n=1 Tax=Falsigemmobacter faecalis TaxID=2488730 RepID=A0A3P3DNK3_9RHOB|nr:thioesterase family protein [Falsigemmobacter faecalis]RRH75820.1 acyl-CoA thioesterase [Falsigemmobacter faecalis]